VAATRILSIIGRKNAGKTTLAVALAAEFARKGRKVMAIKHGSHPADIDREGTDSYRLYHEGKVERVLLATPRQRVIIEKSPDDTDPITLARRYFQGADLVLVEGFHTAPIPKIEVFRKETGNAAIYTPTAADAERWVAIVTDDEAFKAHCPVLHFRDTMWLQLLANIAWEKAQEI
jgi:molybdopterin-guanine dinucleotide biosynthesis protein MobB